MGTLVVLAVHLLGPVLGAAPDAGLAAGAQIGETALQRAREALDAGNLDQAEYQLRRAEAFDADVRTARAELASARQTAAAQVRTVPIGELLGSARKALRAGEFDAALVSLQAAERRGANDSGLRRDIERAMTRASDEIRAQEKRADAERERRARDDRECDFYWGTPVAKIDETTYQLDLGEQLIPAIVRTNGQTHFGRAGCLVRIRARKTGSTIVKLQNGFSAEHQVLVQCAAKSE